MEEKKVCLLCGGSGRKLDGSPCECGAQQKIILPKCLSIPNQYQTIRFDKSFLPKNLQADYGMFMENLITDCTSRISMFSKNLLICAPPNSGKTVFTYTVYGMLYAKGIKTLKFMDIAEARQILLDVYFNDMEQVNLLSTSPVVILKIPMDVPQKFPEIMSSIIERRVRNGGSTIFLYNGTDDDLKAQDRFGKLKYMIGDGSYNSLAVKSWR